MGKRDKTEQSITNLFTNIYQDLDNAAEAGLELNKMLSEVLNSQNGDEAFMSTVEELQRQLNDQDSKYNAASKQHKLNSLSPTFCRGHQRDQRKSGGEES